MGAQSVSNAMPPVIVTSSTSTPPQQAPDARPDAQPIDTGTEDPVMESAMRERLGADMMAEQARANIEVVGEGTQGTDVGTPDDDPTVTNNGNNSNVDAPPNTPGGAIRSPNNGIDATDPTVRQNALNLVQDPNGVIENSTPEQQEAYGTALAIIRNNDNSFQTPNGTVFINRASDVSVELSQRRGANNRTTQDYTIYRPDSTDRFTATINSNGDLSDISEVTTAPPDLGYRESIDFLDIYDKSDLNPISRRPPL